MHSYIQIYIHVCTCTIWTSDVMFQRQLQGFTLPHLCSHGQTTVTEPAAICVSDICTYVWKYSYAFICVYKLADSASNSCCKCVLQLLLLYIGLYVCLYLQLVFLQIFASGIFARSIIIQTDTLTLVELAGKLAACILTSRQTGR